MPAPVTPTGRSSAPRPSLSSAARDWAEGFNFGSGRAVGRLAVDRAKAPSTGPTPLRRAHAFYQAREDQDLGSVRLLRTEVAGQTVYALHTTTDGDDGFLELYAAKGALLASGTTGFDAQGKRTVRWDATPGAVRAEALPRDLSPSLGAFFDAVDVATQPGSPSGRTIAVDELRAAARALVGPELSVASIDPAERMGLLQVLAESKHTAGSRAFGEGLAGLYAAEPAGKLTRLTTGTLGSASAFAASTRTASASVSPASAATRVRTLAALARQAFGGEEPTQLVWVTRSEAEATLRAAGASGAEAKAAVRGLAGAKGRVCAGRFFSPGDGSPPKATGLALFGVSSSGRVAKALHVPAPPTAGPDPGAVVAGLVGASRPVEVLGQRATASGTQFDLAWSPPTGGRIEARLDVPSDGAEASLSKLALPAVVGATELGLAERVGAATGVPRRGLAYAQRGADWLVATRPAGGGPISLAKVVVAVGGATASVTNAKIGAGPAELEVARGLALGLARAHAAAMVDDPAIADAARLEVALRTRWATPDALELVDPAESAVGFDPAKDRAQFVLPSVWGDNAVFVTFQKDGEVRVEDFN